MQSVAFFVTKNLDFLVTSNKICLKKSFLYKIDRGICKNAAVVLLLVQLFFCDDFYGERGGI